MSYHRAKEIFRKVPLPYIQPCCSSHSIYYNYDSTNKLFVLAPCRVVIPSIWFSKTLYIPYLQSVILSINFFVLAPCRVVVPSIWFSKTLYIPYLPSMILSINFFVLAPCRVVIPSIWFSKTLYIPYLQSVILSINFLYWRLVEWLSLPSGSVKNFIYHIYHQ